MIGEAFDRVLVDAQAGDHAAIEQLYRDVAPLVTGYLRSNGSLEAEDTTSEVFISMMQGLPRFRGDERAFRSWLLTITHRRLVDSIRKSGRRAEDPVPIDELGRRMIMLDDAENQAMSRLRSRGLLEAIDKLTPDQRGALMLRVLGDQTVREISSILGKPESAVKALLRRALSSLHRMLEEGSEFSTDRDDRA